MKTTYRFQRALGGVTPLSQLLLSLRIPPVTITTELEGRDSLLAYCCHKRLAAGVKLKGNL